MLMACMRMTCDTPAILDPECRVCPKIEELERILVDLLQESDRKIIIFSEWERMLSRVRGVAGELGVESAWHAGSVPHIRRREEIDRFKNDPDCRLFLSTDSGSVGLNPQAASAVVNIDLPWNPAELEQRIARAWRKRPTRSVSVINLRPSDPLRHSKPRLRFGCEAYPCERRDRVNDGHPGRGDARQRDRLPVLGSCGRFRAEASIDLRGGDASDCNAAQTTPSDEDEYAQCSACGGCSRSVQDACAPTPAH
jgi:hypothetical protein